MSDLVHPVLLEIEGMATAEGSCALGPRNLITGPRGSGKSTKANALKFALLGVVPHPERSEAYTASLMRGNEMRVKVTLSDGRWFSRALVRKGDRLRGEAACSWLPEDAKNTEVGEAIRALAGKSDVQARENLRAGDLVAGSSQELAQRVDALLATNATPIEVLEQWLYALPVLRLSGLPEERWPEDAATAAARGLTLLQDFTEAERGAFAAAHAEARQVLQSKGAAEALTHANKRKREEDAAVKRKAAASAEIEDRHAPAPAMTLEDLGKQRQQRTDRLAEIRAQVRAHDEAKKAREDAEQVARDAQAALDALQASGDVHTRAAALRERATTLTQQAEALVDPAPVTAPLPVEEDGAKIEQALQLEEEACGLDAQAEQIGAAPAPARPTLEEESSIPEPPKPVLEPEPAVDATVLERATSALQLAHESPWARVRHLADDVLGLTVATEQQDRRDLVGGELRGLADKHGGDIDALTQAELDAGAALEAQEAALAEVRARNAALNAEHAKALAAREQALADLRVRNQQRLAEYSTAYAAWEKDQGTARLLRHDAGERRKQATSIRDAEADRVKKKNAAQQAEYRKAFVARGVKAGRIAQERARLNREASEAVTAANDLEQAWMARAASLAEANAKLDGIAVAAPLDLDGAAREQADLEAQVATIDEQTRQVQRADTRRTELAAFARELLTAQASAKVWTAIEWGLKRMRENDLSARSGPLVSAMTRFLRAAGQPETPYLKADGGKVGLGWMRGEESVAIEALSGGEQVVALAALAAAVIGLRSPPLSFLLIEANEWGTDIPALLAGCEEVGDEIGCVLVCTNFKVQSRKGWTNVEVAAHAAVGV